jgi:uncharacterized tellurite resistance protein B-like protein
MFSKFFNEQEIGKSLFNIHQTFEFDLEKLSELVNYLMTFENSEKIFGEYLKNLINSCEVPDKHKEKIFDKLYEFEEIKLNYFNNLYEIYFNFAEEKLNKRGLKFMIIVLKNLFKIYDEIGENVVKKPIQINSLVIDFLNFSVELYEKLDDKIFKELENSFPIGNTRINPEEIIKNINYLLKFNDLRLQEKIKNKLSFLEEG